MVSPPTTSSLSVNESDSQDNFSDVSDGAVIERDDDTTTWTFTCPLTTKTFPSKSLFNDFWETTFNTNLENIVKYKSPLSTTIKSQDAFLYYCTLINYLRQKSKASTTNRASGPSNGHSGPSNSLETDLSLLEILQNIQPTSEFWYDDQYLFPVIPDDPLIRAFDGWEDDDAQNSDEDGLQQDPYIECIGQRFIVGGETVPSREFLTEQAKSLREIGAFD